LGDHDPIPCGDRVDRLHYGRGVGQGREAKLVDHTESRFRLLDCVGYPVVGDLDTWWQRQVEITNDVDLEWLETFDLRDKLGVGEKQRTA
jgi:hypothetical protein